MNLLSDRHKQLFHSIGKPFCKQSTIKTFTLPFDRALGEAARLEQLGARLQAEQEECSACVQDALHAAAVEREA